MRITSHRTMIFAVEFVIAATTRKETYTDHRKSAVMLDPLIRTSFLLENQVVRSQTDQSQGYTCSN
jgi:hypothetical protein